MRRTAGWELAPSRRERLLLGSAIDGQVQPYFFRKVRASAFVSPASSPMKW